MYVSPVKTKTRILFYISCASFFVLETRAVLEAGVAALLSVWYLERRWAISAYTLSWVRTVVPPQL